MSAFDQYTEYEFLWFFVIYAFLGWCTEVAYAAVCLGKFVNRGFLNGPVCPIYGFGVTIVIAALTPLAENSVILFLGSVLLTSALEWITGFVLEKVFHDKWWDYSDVPFNLNGYICLKFSLLWGLACLFIMDVFHPTVVSVVSWIPQLVGSIIVGILLLVLAADAGVTAGSILKLNKKLEQMDEIAALLREASDHLGETISENVVELMEKTEEIQGQKDELMAQAKVQATELKQQMESLRTRYEELAQERKFIHNRVMKAFPGMKSRNHADIFEELKKRYGIK